MILVITQTANCLRVERNWFCQMERFLRTVFAFAIIGRRTFFLAQAYFKLNGRVNKQNMHYQSADNPDWLITKSLHSERVTVWCAHFTVPPTYSHTVRVLFSTNNVRQWRFTDLVLKSFLLFSAQMITEHAQINHSLCKLHHICTRTSLKCTLSRNL